MYTRNQEVFYNSLSSYFRSRYGGRVGKICLDGGFTCPNRDGTAGVGGCIFCGERGAGEHIRQGVDIRSQVESFFASLSPKREQDRFVAYFQNFTNTYAPAELLRSRYSQALIDDRIVALAVGTRPDCISQPVVEVLKSFQGPRDVWVELGLQTSSDTTASIINRGYPTARFTDAVGLLNDAGINVVVHIIIGLPDNKPQFSRAEEEIRQTTDFLVRHRLWGIKIHSLYVMRGTRLEQMYREGLFEPIDQETYIDRAIDVLTHIPPDWVVHRLTGDCTSDRLVAPDWILRKPEILNRLRSKMADQNLTQGCLYSNTGG